MKSWLCGFKSLLQFKRDYDAKDYVRWMDALIPFQMRDLKQVQNPPNVDESKQHYKEDWANIPPQQFKTHLL